jgi:hypothetical protein
MDHIMVLSGTTLLMFGGYNNNFHFDDTWYFYTSTPRYVSTASGDLCEYGEAQCMNVDIAGSPMGELRWLEKESFVWPQWPDSCTDDWEFIEENNCSLLSWPLDLERSATEPWDPLPLGMDTQVTDDNFQEYRAPQAYTTLIDYDGDGALDEVMFFGVFDHDQEVVLSRATYGLPISVLPPWTPIPPFSATAPRQYYREIEYQFNATVNITLLEWCGSVKGEPTRGMNTSGTFGRSPEPIHIPQPRNRAPGWDGCRDRQDGRDDLEAKLQWLHPSQRSDHTSVFHPKLDGGMLVFYGGQGYNDTQQPSTKNTPFTSVRSDFWQFRIDSCPSNCSTHGDCDYGFCVCDPGYYGVDCSNVSCPGDFCYYDQTTKAQECVHCCHAGYNHSDTDEYVDDQRKVPCNPLIGMYGEINGVCDGFGTCQCAPPYIGEDCSIKDCANNCSYNGWCSVEYPISRCMCHPGYYGDHCQYTACLNDCSYPNGECNITTGTCNCHTRYNPYNNTRAYQPWMGDDCSWLVAFAAGSTLRPDFAIIGAMLAVLGATLWSERMGEER